MEKMWRKYAICAFFRLNWDWCSHFVSPYAPLGQAARTNPLCPPGAVVERASETKTEPSELNLWGHQLQQLHHQIVTFVFLLLLVALSIIFCLLIGVFLLFVFC